MKGRRKRKLPLVSPLLPRQKGERRKVEFLGGAAVSLFTIVIVVAFGASGLQQALLHSSNVAAVVSVVLVDLANQDRASNDLAALTMNPVLVAAAQAKANDMAEKGYFAHVSPDGIDPWHWFKQAGYNFSYAGENLAVDFSDSGDVNSAWMNSPAHRANLLNPKFTEVGIATAQGMYQGRSTTFVVQEFGTPGRTASQAPVTAIVPTAPTTPALAAVQDKAQVLGAAAAPPRPIPSAIATTDPAVAAALAVSASGNLPLWSSIVGFPRDTMRHVYYAIGLLVLLALAFDTSLELHRRHRRRAFIAGTLLLSMGILFFVAEYVFFAQPVLAAVGIPL